MPAAGPASGVAFRVAQGFPRRWRACWCEDKQCLSWSTTIAEAAACAFCLPPCTRPVRLGWLTDGDRCATAVRRNPSEGLGYSIKLAYLRTDLAARFIISGAAG